MAFWIASTVAAAAAYLLGSVPTGYLAGRLLKGIDIRAYGSGSTGATNVLRALGKGPALAVLLLDALKGAAAIVLAGWLCRALAAPPGRVPWAVALAGLAVLVGHGRSIWLNFTGGKSVAAGFGLLLALSWPVGLGAAAAFGLAVALFRIVSLGSMLAAATAIALVCGFEQPLPYRLLVIAGGFYVTLRHRANLRRLWAGTEPRLGQGGVDRTGGPQAEAEI